MLASEAGLKMISTVVIFLASRLIIATSVQNIPQPVDAVQILAIPPPIGADAVQVFALPVGQGDCTIIQCPNGNIVVFDCGSSGGNRMTADEVAGWLGSDIDRVVAILVTHANRDHYNYLPAIQWNTTNTRAVIIGGAIESYPAGTIRSWLNRWGSLSKLFIVGTAARQSSPSSCIRNCIVNTDTNFCNDQKIQFNILATNVGSTANQRSIVMKIVVGQWSMLLSGDMEGDASVQIANQLNGDLQSVVYKMSHHGASTSANMIDWLRPIAPQFAFASSGYNFGKCKHPRCDTIKRLISLKTITMTTPHQFYCGNPGGNPSTDNTFQLNMLQTSPNATHICLLTYVSSNIQPQSNCFLPTTQFQLTDDMDVDDGDCDDSTEVAITGGAFHMTMSSFVFTAAVLLCAII